ncbi:MBL fold metallo-hydrolase [Pseudonocardia sp. HH130630-07]|uniref:MBL fold metallo-hydrolase n=1 Tax=Pseudonocardia sp. HH130630-07 TaxID=1690815 RepID=UPI000814E59D|nr:MBL fold metallo-hydrolase [Pseudonocardia sp. HH130630-07]ANY08230.1 MBL fold metallo-hydrolase [Pseudonocardia sp. HH130630-07]
MPSLTTPVPGLHATGTARLPYQDDVLLRSFLLERPAGNVLVHNSPGLTTDAHAIADLGGASHLLVNHEHEAMYGDPGLDVPVFVHERDRAATARSMLVTGTFGDRRMLDDDLEVIPTPGHTAGTTCFLWDSGLHRFLFTGDFVWISDGEWQAVVLDPALREDYLESLALVRDLDFDVLVPWGVSERDACVAMTTRDETRARIDAMIARVGAGEGR